MFLSIFAKKRINTYDTQLAEPNGCGISRSASPYQLVCTKGEREPNFETLEFIADTFNVDMNYLLGKKIFH